MTLIRRFWKIFRSFLLALVLITGATAIALQTAAVQTWLVNTVTRHLEGVIDGQIQIGKIHLRPFNTAVLRDVVILDSHPYEDDRCERIDTLFSAACISASFDLKGLAKGQPALLDYARIQDGQLFLVTEPFHDPADPEKKSLLNLSRVFRLGSSEPKEKKEPKDLFEIRKVCLDRFHFRMRNYRNRSLGIHKASEGIPGTIDWGDMDLKDIHLKSHDLSFKKGIVSGVVEELTVTEKSGYSIRHLSGKTRVGHGQTLIEDLRLTDPWSDLDIPHLSFTYANTQSWSDFEEEVHLDGQISPSILNLKSISYFAGSLKKMSFLTELQGSICGIVNDFTLSDLKIKTLDSNVEGILSGKIAQVTSAGQMYMDLQAKDLTFDTGGLGRFIRSWSSSSRLDLSRFAPGQPLVLNAAVKGLLDDFKVNGNIRHEDGLIDTDIRIRNVTLPAVPISIDGQLETRDLHVGQIVGVKAIGPCSLYTRFETELGESPSVHFDTLNISRLNALDYDYSGILANGTYSNNIFNGKVICNDPNLNLLFQGIFTTPSKKIKNAVYRFYANLGYADLNALHLDKRGVSRIKFLTNTNFTHIKDGNTIGKISINGLELEDNSGKHQIGDIAISSHINEDINRIKLESQFAEGYYTGSEFIGQFIADLQAATTCREIPALHGQKILPWKGNSYDMELKFHDCTSILSFLAPGMYVADSTRLRLNITEEGLFTGSLQSRRIAFKEKYVKGVRIRLDNLQDRLTGLLEAQELNVAPLYLKNNRLQLSADDGLVDWGFRFDNQSEDINKGDIQLSTRFLRSPEDSLLMEAHLKESNVYFENSRWKINPTDLRIGNGHWEVAGLHLTNGQQMIQLDGGYSPRMTDTLEVRLDRFELGVMNKFIKQDLDLQSKITGYAQLISPSASNVGILLDMVCDSTSMGGEAMGRVHLKSAWDDLERKFKFLCSNDLQEKNTIRCVGSFRPADQFIQAQADLHGLNFAYARPFLKSIFNEVEGQLDGSITADGTFRDLNIQGRNLYLRDGRLTLDFTKVPYSVNGPLLLNDSGLFFNDVAMRDDFGAQGELSGGILWNHLKDMYMDTYVTFADMEAMRTTLKDNQSFYGHVFGTGNVHIQGPFNALLLEVNATTAKNGKFHVPLSHASTSTTSNLLTFKEPEQTVYVDPYELMMNKLKEKEETSSNLGVRLKLNVTPDTQALLEIDQASGNVLTGWGRGYLDLDIKPSTDVFNINGDFNIVGGTYHFGAMGLTYRDFTIQNGGTVKFNGDIMESDLDLTALYKTKTNIGILIADTTSMSRRQVERGIGINGKIKNPMIKFNINVPDLDPTTQSRVESALSTEDKVQKQFLSLLLTNSFLPDEQSGIVNNNSLLYSNVTEIMANQLNNILQKLDIPIDLGLDYQQGNNGKNAFDVAVSTELFNNRVIVNGTFGSRQYNNSDNQNEFVGDLDIEVKLDASGALRLNLFSHSADQYSSYLDNSQRSGVGLTYQHEFNTIGEFFRGLFQSKKQKEAEKEALRKQNRSEPKIKIKIEPEEKSSLETQR